jgi:hypothetical protein
MSLAFELGRADVRYPYLNRSEPLCSEPAAVFTYSLRDA